MRTRGAGDTELEEDPIVVDDDFELDDEDAKYVVSSPRRPSGSGTGRKRGRPRLPRDAEGNIVHPSGKKSRSRSQLEDDEEAEDADYGRENSILDADDTGMVVDEDDETASAGVPSGTVTPVDMQYQVGGRQPVRPFR